MSIPHNMRELNKAILDQCQDAYDKFGDDLLGGSAAFLEGDADMLTRLLGWYLADGYAGIVLETEFGRFRLRACADMDNNTLAVRREVAVARYWPGEDEDAT